MAKKCIECGNPVWGKGYCKNHQNLRTDKKQKKIQPFSAKQKIKNAEYNARVKEWKIENPWCCFPGCNNPTEDNHHSRGRGKYLMDESTWKPLCRNHHDYCEMHPIDAIELGLTQSRLT